MIKIHNEIFVYPLLLTYAVRSWKLEMTIPVDSIYSITKKPLYFRKAAP